MKQLRKAIRSKSAYSKKKQPGSDKTVWILLIFVALIIVLDCLKNYTWLKKQDSKPFGYVDKFSY